MQPSTTAAATKNFWEDANLFPDQNRAQGLVQAYKSNTGNVGDQGSFASLYNGGQDLGSISNSLKSSAQGAAWLNPSSRQAEEQLNSFVVQNPIDVYNRMTEQLGIGDVRTRVTNMRREIANSEALLGGVSESVAGRTSGSLVTEAQRQALVNQERNPIQSLLSTQGRNLDLENQSLADLIGQADKMTGYTVQGESTQRQSLLDRLTGARERERVEEERRRAEEETKRWWENFNRERAEADRAFALQQAQFNEAKRQASANLAALTRQNSGGGAKAAPKAQTNPMEQAAYNEVRNMLNSGDQNRINREIAAINKSAGFGNQKDKAKLVYIMQLRGDTSISANALANGGQLRF